MDRTRLKDLKDWLSSDDRTPLIIRGARQVGKTWLVRQIAASASLTLIEFNFEDRKQDASLFRTNDPHATLKEISASRGMSINPSESLLFLDEIQAAPELLEKLRWFAEKMPELPVIATGSLLDFALEKYSHSMPVGRIGYLYLEPLSFEEFLLAKKQAGLFDYISEYSIANTIPQAIHEQLMSLFKEYTIIGGLPSAVSSWIHDESLIKVNKIHNNLLSTYQDDFGKYRGRLAIDKLEDVIHSIPHQLSQKFVYSRVSADIHSKQIRQALELLNKARICHQVVSCHANGLPLSAEKNEKYFKEIYLDTGLCSAQLGLNLSVIQSLNALNLINNGAIAEQVAGQILRTLFPSYINPALYCWIRERSGSNSEIDYIIQHQNQIIPVEIKAGTTGSLKSLHYFMGEKKGLEHAVRVNSDYPSKVNVNVKTSLGKPVSYTLLSIPFYLLGQLSRLL